MNSLDTAVELLRQPRAAGKARTAARALLVATAGDLRTAIRVWEKYLAQPGADGDRFALMSWIGPARAKELHEICLRANEHVESFCRLAGPAAGRFAALDEDLVEMAYRQLKPGETGAEAAKLAIETMQSRLKYLDDLMKRMDSTGSARKPSKRPARRRAAPTRRATKSKKKVTRRRPPRKK